MTANLQKALEGIGLDPKESIVYMACLELSGSANSEIAKKAGLNRVTTYEILKRLLKRGTVVSFEKNKVKSFAAVEPQVLIRQAAQRVAVAEHFLPELSALANKGEKKPKVYFYEGIEGIKSIYEDSLTATTEILTFTNPADVRSLLGDAFVNGYVRERVRRGIRVRGMAPDDASGKQEAATKKVLRETRLFHRGDYGIQNEIMIYDDTLAIFSGRDEMGLLIKNPSLVESFRSIWRMAWESI